MSEEDFQLQEQAQEASLAQLQAGGIPISAERRLRELQQRGGSYTSDLSVADFALCHQLGLRPLSQVMGSCVYQIGYQGALYGAEAEMSEMTTLSQAWNTARDRAFARLAEEARCVGASAVVGVDVRSTVADLSEAGGYGTIEYVITGTAVARDGRGSQHDAGKHPVMTELSVADYAKLLTAGIEPAGIVAWTSVFFASSLFIRAERALGVGVSFQNFELRELTQCFYSARERVTSEIGRQAGALGASGIVDVRIRHTANPGSLYMGAGMGQSPGVIASFSAIGTAVHEGQVVSPQTPMTAIELTG
jgi:uncharacterized protein YbjQ (UPF0145 family)